MGEGQSCDTDQDLDLGAWTGPQGRTYKYIYLVNKQKQNTRNTGSAIDRDLDLGAPAQYKQYSLLRLPLIV